MICTRCKKETGDEYTRDPETYGIICMECYTENVEEVIKKSPHENWQVHKLSHKHVEMQIPFSQIKDFCKKAEKVFRQHSLINTISFPIPSSDYGTLISNNEPVQTKNPNILKVVRG